MAEPVVSQQLPTNEHFTDIIFIPEWPFQQVSADKGGGGGLCWRGAWRLSEDLLDPGLTPEHGYLAG